MLGKPAPPAPEVRDPRETAAELLAASKERKRGDWQRALDICLLSRRRARRCAAVDLNIMICEYHLGRDVGLANRAINLAPTLRPLGLICAWGIALLSAHRAGNLEQATRVACALANSPALPWDLPTIPRWVFPHGDDVIVEEDISAAPVLDVVEELRARHTNSPDEERLLGVLAQRYRGRVVPPAGGADRMGPPLQAAPH